MKKYCLLLLICSVTISSYAQRGINVLHYSHNIELTDTSDTISGYSVIDLLIENNTTNILLDLKNMGANGKGMTVWSAGYLVKEKYFKNFEHSKDKIVLKGDFKSGDTISASIVYKGVPADGLIISKNKFGKRTFFADNWPNRAHHWIPCVDDPADKATVEFFVFAPEHYKVIANGMLIQETPVKNKMKLTQWKEEVPLPTKVMVIGVADFAVNLAGMVNGCIPVTSWVYPENIEGFMDYAIAKDILQWFIHYIGPYPYQKLSNVQSKTNFGGMENAGAIFYAESTVNGQRTEERLFAHEIVHQWFGNHATEKSFAHLWLSEGFATYLTHIYMEYKYGREKMDERMKDDRETVIEYVKATKRPVVDSTSDYMKLLGPNSYQKGSWVLHMLRRELGDSVFHKSIREYYTTYAGKNADTDDFRKVVEKISGKELKQYFWQWLYLPDNPRLEITWKLIPEQKKVSIKIDQLQMSGLFHFPLEILLTDKNNKTQLKKLQISRQSETFFFPYTETIKSIFPDPYTSLLFEARINNP